MLRKLKPRNPLFLVALMGAVLVLSATANAARPWPDTTRGIHVFNDLLYPMTDEQVRFAALNYAGSQKLYRSDADRLRRVNPNFLVLDYRLGIGLGYRIIEGDCAPTGDWIGVVEGNEYVQEWPGDGAVDGAWLYDWAGADRVLNCDWGWYLADLDNPGWRSYWQGEVLRQIRANDDDGVFMDSLSVPNYLGGDRYRPVLPAFDEGFESEWSRRIERWIEWLQTQPVGNYGIIPNVGSWITSRETTDYSAADGVMVEGFGIGQDTSPYDLADWQLQMDRSLDLIDRGRIYIGQSYALGAQERMFTLGSYLLIKGNRTFINIDTDSWGYEPEWWPEYDIPIGSPAHSAGRSIASLYDEGSGAYRRRFDNGEVIVNPTNPWDGTGRDVTVRFDRPRRIAVTAGGGNVTTSGERPAGTSVTYREAESVTLGPFSAAVVVDSVPDGGGGDGGTGTPPPTPTPQPTQPGAGDGGAGNGPVAPRPGASCNVAAKRALKGRALGLTARKRRFIQPVSCTGSGLATLTLRFVVSGKQRGQKKAVTVKVRFYAEGGQAKIKARLPSTLAKRLSRARKVTVNMEVNDEG